MYALRARDADALATFIRSIDQFLTWKKFIYFCVIYYYFLYCEFRRRTCNVVPNLNNYFKVPLSCFVINLLSAQFGLIKTAFSTFTLFVQIFVVRFDSFKIHICWQAIYLFIFAIIYQNDNNANLRFCMQYYNLIVTQDFLKIYFQNYYFAEPVFNVHNFQSTLLKVEQLTTCDFQCEFETRVGCQKDLHIMYVIEK